MPGTEPVLRIRDLRVSYYTDAGRAIALDGAFLDLRAGERLGLVGESGSGKSTMALAMMRMIKPPGRIESGQVIVDGTDLMALSDLDMRKARLSKIAYIPQGAMNSLNPVTRVGAQMVDAVKAHEPEEEKAKVVERCMQALESVDLKQSVFRMYAHELSGGMKQRVCIAIDILLKPQVIIADEPTSALDVVTQRQVMETIRRVQAQIGAAVILIGHDMGLMAQFVDKVAVMYAGAGRGQRRARDVHPAASPLRPGADQQPPPPGEQGCLPGDPGPRALSPAPARRMLVSPPVLPGHGRLREGEPARRDHARWQTRCLPPVSGESVAMGDLLQLVNVRKVYSRGLISRTSTVALSDVSLTLKENEPTILTVAGESGSGKTTLAMLLLGFLPPTSGKILYKGRDIGNLTGDERMTFRREVQAVFQDPFAVFNPFYTVDHLLTVPIRRFRLAKSRADARDRMVEALTAVGLHPDDILDGFPTSSRAASASASTWPVPSSSSPGCSWRTSRCPWWMRHCGRASWKHCGVSSGITACRSSTSRTTLPPPTTSRNRSSCSTGARSWRPGTRTR